MRGAPSHVKGGGMGCPVGSSQRAFSPGVVRKARNGRLVPGGSFRACRAWPGSHAIVGLRDRSLEPLDLVSGAATWLLVRGPHSGPLRARPICSPLLAQGVSLCSLLPLGACCARRLSGPPRRPHASPAKAAEPGARLSPAIAMGAGPPRRRALFSRGAVFPPGPLAFRECVKAAVWSQPEADCRPDGRRQRATSRTSSGFLLWSGRWLPAIMSSGSSFAPGCP